MAIPRAMSGGGPPEEEQDEHDHDVVMPGFRFHPTEEELIEFYLRRKVEGKRFNVELITFLDLYRHDPWELPALATIGEKEWFFYVPRDRKYRNGDRPNRVTTSGYWKATGADRMIRTDNFRSIGLKKTLVFYYGKAPKGIRTSWIMNEYRLPQQETDRYQKAEISLCRVYKRAGVEDHSSVPNSVSPRPSSSRGLQETLEGYDKNSSPAKEKEKHIGGSSSSSSNKAAADHHRHHHFTAISPTEAESFNNPLASQQQPSCMTFSCSSSSSSINTVEELHKLAEFQPMFDHHYHHPQLLQVPSSLQPLQTFPEKLWQWSNPSGDCSSLK